ncbi:MAG TPA: GTP 3',8-cyclase MoaA [Candidatus Limnocylindrales bacterium]|jgi:cyclic pyranopterin phosphate synthase|nr:GTP 3',8-cyclase MoaA [Candidatus Limnocylindrales bacterium]
MTSAGLLTDSHGRILRDLRVSLTDRCNFRCLYCLPETEAAQNFYRGRWAHLPNSAPILQQWVPKQDILSFEEIERVVRLAVDSGIQKIRLTGGEPLLRNGVELLVQRLAALAGIVDLAMTTNGFLFPKKAQSLRQAGLQRVSFSLDSLDQANFKKITGRDGLREVLASIKLARDLGFHPIKVNAVIIRDLNEHEIEDLAEFAREQDLSIRYIEFMPLDSARAWLKELVVPGREILARLQARFTLQPLPLENPSSTSRRWAFADGRGEIGVIAPVSEPFCGHCNRLRLTADGKIRTCLFSVTEHDLRSRLRQGDSDANILEWLRGVVLQKEARHHIGEPDFIPPNRSMSCIGG